MGIKVAYNLQLYGNVPGIFYFNPKGTNLIPPFDLALLIKGVMLGVIVHQGRIHDHALCRTEAQFHILVNGDIFKRGLTFIREMPGFIRQPKDLSTPPGMGVSPNLWGISFLKLINRTV